MPRALGRSCKALQGRSSGLSELREVILTFSGKVRVSSGSDIWTTAASVMKSAGANIQSAGGTFVRMPLSIGDKTPSTTFSVSAFGAHISPSQLAVDSHGEEDFLGCALYIKAVVPGSGLTRMQQLLQTQSPLQVYTVSLGTKSNVAVPRAEQAGSGGTIPRIPPSSATDTLPLATRRKGWLYLFGVDRPGQLARITETLGRFGVTILHVRVHSGIADVDECDFVVTSTSGPLAENRIRFTFDDDKLDEAREEVLRQEIQRIGPEVGYAVTCLMTDVGDRLRMVMPSYLLRRKAFAMSYLDTVRWMRRTTTRSARKTRTGVASSITPCRQARLARTTRRSSSMFEGF